MFRPCSKEDFPQVVDLYNEITNRGRTLDQHGWEWLKSPFKSESFIIYSKKHDFLGHHGYLGIELFIRNEKILAAKTENTILKKGFGSIYFPNEQKIFNSIKQNYHLIFTTTATENIARIREKLGYDRIANYCLKFLILDFTIVAEKVTSQKLSRILISGLKVLNHLMAAIPIRYSKKFTYESDLLTKVDLTGYSDLSKRATNNYKIIQSRSVDYLVYRLLTNPYKKYFRIFLYDEGELKGGIIYYFSGNSVFIEDVLFETEFVFKHLLKYLAHYTRMNKTAKVIKALTLQGSILDKIKFSPYYVREPIDNGYFMVNPLVSDKKFNVKDFYFTPLFMEGIA